MTAEVSQVFMGWLKLVARANIPSIFVTAEVLIVLTGWFNFEAAKNIQDTSVRVAAPNTGSAELNVLACQNIRLTFCTRGASQVASDVSKQAAPSKRPAMLVTSETSHVPMLPLYLVSTASHSARSTGRHVTSPSSLVEEGAQAATHSAVAFFSSTFVSGAASAAATAVATRRASAFIRESG